MKETFYLKHDYNSRNDERILSLRSVLGVEGYGIYWMVLEKLGESSEGRLRLLDFDSLAYELHVPCERIADVIHSYDLFKNDGVYFWSSRLMSDLSDRNEKTEMAKLAAKIRWHKEALSMQTHSECNANAMQGEERRGEEKKEKKTYVVPIGTEKENGIKILIELYTSLYQKKYGVAPVVSWERHVRILKKYAAALEEAKIVLEAFFVIDDPFIVDSCHSIAVFCTADVFNRVRTELIKNKNTRFLSLISQNDKRL